MNLPMDSDGKRPLNDANLPAAEPGGSDPTDYATGREVLLRHLTEALVRFKALANHGNSTARLSCWRTPRTARCGRTREFDGGLGRPGPKEECGLPGCSAGARNEEFFEDAARSRASLTKGADLCLLFCTEGRASNGGG